MAIISEFPSTRWNISLDTSLPTLVPGDISVTGNTVTAVSGAGQSWVLTLGIAVSTLLPAAITVSGASVTSTSNADIAMFLEQIRNILRIGLTQDDLPDATIEELVFLRRAELTTYEKTGKTEAQYDSETAMNTAAAQALRDRFRISVMYRTAALLVPALPDIVRESFQSELRQYVQMDWEQKINFFLSQSDDAIEEDLPTTADVSSVGSVGSSYTRYTAF